MQRTQDDLTLRRIPLSKIRFDDDHMRQVKAETAEGGKHYLRFARHCERLALGQRVGIPIVYGNESGLGAAYFASDLSGSDLILWAEMDGPIGIDRTNNVKPSPSAYVNLSIYVKIIHTSRLSQIPQLRADYLEANPGTKVTDDLPPANPL